MKKILIIIGHPYKESYNRALAASYKKGALEYGAEVKEIFIGELDFNPNLQYGYTKRMDLEPDLLDAWEKIQWAEHIVWVHPVWWSGFPAIMKGFIDRLFLPHMVYEFKGKTYFWKKLLTNKTGHIITTLDQPRFFYWLLLSEPSIKQLKNAVLRFCGISPVRVTVVSALKLFGEEKRKKILQKIYILGTKGK